MVTRPHYRALMMEFPGDAVGAAIILAYLAWSVPLQVDLLC